MPFWVYVDYASPDNHYDASGYMGDHRDISVDLNSINFPYRGNSALKFSMVASDATGEGWAGLYFQDPPNNWGTMHGGYNLQNAKKLTFFARGKTGKELIYQFKVGGIKGDLQADTAVAFIQNIRLTKDWKQYTINLEGYNLSNIVGGFCWIAIKKDNPDGLTFYIDDIRFE